MTEKQQSTQCAATSVSVFTCWVRGNQPPSHKLWSAAGAESSSAAPYLTFCTDSKTGADGEYCYSSKISTECNSNRHTISNIVLMCAVYSCCAPHCNHPLSLLLPNCSASLQNAPLASLQQSKPVSANGIRSASLSSSGAARIFSVDPCATPDWQKSLAEDTADAATQRYSSSHCDTQHHEWDVVSTSRSPAAELESTTQRGQGRSPPGRCFQMKLLRHIPAVSSSGSSVNCEAGVGVCN